MEENKKQSGEPEPATEALVEWFSSLTIEQRLRLIPAEIFLAGWTAALKHIQGDKDA